MSEENPTYEEARLGFEDAAKEIEDDKRLRNIDTLLDTTSEELSKSDRDLPAKCVKSQQVLELQEDGTNNSYAFYQHGEDQNKTLTIPKVLFEDLGCPTKITVTVRPGDLLN